MNWEQVEGSWKQIKGGVRAKWAKLTDDDVELISGKKDTLLGKLQERYGMLKEDAERHVDQWLKELDANRAQKT